MVYKKKSKGLIILSVLSIAFLGAVFFFADGHYLPTPKPCRPISYPTGETINIRPSQMSDITTSDSFDQVITFYNDILEPQIGWDNWTGGDNWKVEQIEGNIYIYECFSRENYTIGNTAEQGCIFVKEVGKETIVRTVLYRIGDYSPCPIAPHAYDN